ncbi:MAG: hypothetical protein LBV18_00075 [Alistipes sp.]|jgi:hypothetical protein|nr:hypothetical protein [Alistipes sp.]
MTVLYLCGAYSLLFALFHAGFWRIFGWRRDLPNLSNIEAFGIDRRIMHVLNIQMIWVLIAVAFVCFAFPADLVGTGLGRTFLVCSSVFWLVRAALQPVFMGGKVVTSLIMTMVFLVGAVLFALPVFNVMFS